MEKNKQPKTHKRLLAEIPNNLHEKFKTVCRKNDTQMNKVLIKMVSQYTRGEFKD